MYNNPLIPQLRTLLAGSSLATHEYALIRQLVEQGSLPKDYAATPLALFQTHFLIMNALYQLQDEWLIDGLYLHISALDIHVEDCSERMTDSRALGVSGLRDFYLDWQHYEAASEASVDSLLNTFWQKYASRDVGEDEQREAMAALGLSGSEDFATIKQCYRRLVMIHHPDRGGNRESLQRINAAMAVLERVYGM